MSKKSKISVAVLLLVISILLIFLLYVFVAKPAIQDYDLVKQNQGYEFAVVSIMQSAMQCQQVPLTYENYTVNIIATECLKQP